MSSVVIAGDTSGSITLAAPAVAGSNTITLPANTGTVITTASNGQVIPKAALPTGSVLQVINNIAAVNFSTSSTSYVDTGMNATITPTASSSKILAIVSFVGHRVNAGYVLAKLYRNTTDITTAGNGFFSAGNSTTDYNSSAVIFTLLDSPATTSSITYRIYGRYDGGGTSTLFGYAGNNSGTGQASNYSITLMEIAA